MLHGIAAAGWSGTQPGVSDPRVRGPSPTAAERAGLRHDAGEVTAWLVSNWDTPSGMLSEAAATALADQVHDAVARSGDSQRIRSRVRGRHGLCSLLVLAVRNAAPLAEVDSLAGQAAAGLVVPDTHGFTDTVMSELVSHVVADSVSSAFGGPIAQAQEVLRALRMLAVAACPDPPHHVELWRSCAGPLSEEVTHERGAVVDRRSASRTQQKPDPPRGQLSAWDRGVRLLRAVLEMPHQIPSRSQPWASANAFLAALPIAPVSAASTPPPTSPPAIGTARAKVTADRCVPYFATR